LGRAASKGEACRLAEKAMGLASGIGSRAVA